MRFTGLCTKDYAVAIPFASAEAHRQMPGHHVAAATGDNARAPMRLITSVAKAPAQSPDARRSGSKDWRYRQY